MCSLEKRGNIYILTITGEDDHRLSPELTGAIRSALLRIRSDPASHGGSTALITTSQGKFFSNGLDLAWSRGSASRIREMTSEFGDLIADLLSLPMPTIAAVTGHASAAALMLVLSHDFILMRKDRGFLYMSELDIGLNISAAFSALIRRKVGDPRSRREIVLKASKITGEIGVEMGIVDAAFDGAEETVKQAVKLAKDLAGKGWNGEIYSEIRLRLLKEVSDGIQSDGANDTAIKIFSSKI